MTIYNNFFFRRITQLLRPASVLIVAGCALWLGLQHLINHSKTVAGASASGAVSHLPSQPAQGCDREPTGVETSNYRLRFNVPPGLMPDPQFDGKPATLQVHRVRPIYANGKCHGVPNLAAVLIHGRTIPGPVAFDLRHPTRDDPEGGELSLQESLARAGIDTFAPSLLGYGLSTRFDEGLNDPCNASLPAYDEDDPNTCSFKEGCDRSFNTGIFPLSQQTRFFPDGLLPAIDGLGVNPLAGQRCEHSSGYRFARIDVWARDISQVIDDAIARAQPDNNKVVLLGYSLGGVHVARTLYLLGKRQAENKVQQVVFLSSLFNRLPGAPVELNLPTEEPASAALSASFPMALTGHSQANADFLISPERESVCSGRVISGVPDDYWEQLMKLDVLGRDWGGNDPRNPAGLIRSPTFSSYGWNRSVAATFTIPTLILHGLDDLTSPPLNSNNIFDALTSVTNKLLVQVKCGSHQMQYEGCSGRRCNDRDPNTTPYGGNSDTWAGPHSTTSAALIEWIKHGTFNGARRGRFVINESGVVSN